MTPDEAAAIRYALLYETNPNHLVGFASALAPDEAVAASLLFARAQVLERRRELGPTLTSELLGLIDQVATTPHASSEHLPTLAEQAWRESSSFGQRNAAFEHGVLRVAGDIVARPEMTDALLATLPPATQMLVRSIVVELIPNLSPPIRFIVPEIATLLRADPQQRSPDQDAERARWVRQYVREVAHRGLAG